MKKIPVAIEKRGLRVEFEGQMGPTHLVVPVVFQPGKHSDVKIRVRPRIGVSLRNEVTFGDALQMTFSRSHATSVGGSFFATASHTRTFGIANKAYEVVSLPDFMGILFQLHQYEVKDEAIGIQLAFPISSWESCSTDDYFAEISLEIKRNVIQTICVPREVHPKAGRVLFLSGYSSPSAILFGSPDHLSSRQFPYIVIPKIKDFKLDELPDLLKQGFNGIHLLTNVTSQGILVNDEYVSPHDFFQTISGFGLNFLYLDTCNSVQVVSSFRATDIGALIASTESLYVSYANKFEKYFYDALGNGAFVSEAFHHAAKSILLEGDKFKSFTRSDVYNPMFLDLKADFSFREKV